MGTKHTKDVAYLSGLVYFTQGALGVVAVALPIHLRTIGWSVSEIAVATSIVGFPWVLKILYGLLSDCVPFLGYRRKSYLILFAALASSGWLGMVLAPPDKLPILAALILANIGFAATDVITDGLVVEHSRGFTSHFYQSISWGTRSLGAILSGFAGGWLAAHWKPQQVFMIAMCLPILTVLIALHIREKKKVRTKTFQAVGGSLKKCFQMLWRPQIRWFLLFIGMTQVSASFGVPFFFHMKEGLKFDETFLGLLMSLGWIGAVVGSLLYAKWLSKVELQKVLRWAIIMNVINILSTYLILNKLSAVVFIILGGFLGCLTLLPVMATAALLSHQSGIEGTFFAVLMSIYNLAQIAFGYLGGKLYNLTGVAPLIGGSAVITAFILLIIPKLQLQHRRETV